jgi:hypothetical protein
LSAVYAGAKYVDGIKQSVSNHQIVAARAYVHTS